MSHFRIGVFSAENSGGISGKAAENFAEVSGFGETASGGYFLYIKGTVLQQPHGGTDAQSQQIFMRRLSGKFPEYPAEVTAAVSGKLRHVADTDIVFEVFGAELVHLQNDITGHGVVLTGGEQ